VLGRYVPDALFERPKQGFDVPIGAWLRGPLREWARHLLDSSRLRREGLLDSHQVEECWRDHLSGRTDRARELWAILMVQAWLDAARDVTPPWRSAAAVEAVSPSSEVTVRIRRPAVVSSESRA
jgi:asparagine synthase (glutamine-hydrolysing)